VHAAALVHLQAEKIGHQRNSEMEDVKMFFFRTRVVRSNPGRAKGGT
jgi:hypothetical protein